MNELKKCPKCGRSYKEHSAISREDDRTEICPDCGIHEALAAAGIDPQLSREILVRLIKERYKPGMRVRLLHMEDVQAPPVGTEGTVRGVDDLGSVMVAWDNGCGLNAVLDEDEIEIVEKRQ